MRPAALTLMWSTSTIMLRFISPLTAYSPRRVRPRLLHCASLSYVGTLAPAGSSLVTSAGAAALPVGLSCCGPLHFSVFQKVPVERNWPMSMAVPMVPESIRTPHRALSNLWHRNMLRTPSLYSSSRPLSMSAWLHWGTSRICLQPKGSEVSTPSTTASLPSATTWRAWVESVTMRKKPLPFPP